MSHVAELLRNESIAHGASLDGVVSTRRARVKRFLVLVSVYVSLQVILRWCEYPLFRADNWYYFGPRSLPRFEIFYRWFLTLLPIAAWGIALFFVLTRASWLIHRRVAFALVLAGLAFLEADMRWFHMSRSHVGLREIQVFFHLDPRHGIGLRTSDFEEVAMHVLMHFGVLLLCLIASGPELLALLCYLSRTRLGKNRLNSILTGGIGKVGRALRPLQKTRIVTPFCTVTARSLVVFLVLVDPVVIWVLDQQEQDLEESRSVIRELAETNPLRLQCLDRLWDRTVSYFSVRGRDIRAANLALVDLEPASPFASEAGERFVPLARGISEQLESVLIIQVESLNASIFEETDLPFLSEFSKKCLKLRRHSSTGNCTHYGVLGLLHGHPATFYSGNRSSDLPCAYLRRFREEGFRTRLFSMKLMDHHFLGKYIGDWTEPVYEAGYDWATVTEFAKHSYMPGPRFDYLFYSFTHYPYRHDDQYARYQPEVPFDFSYFRSDLSLYRDQIMNRYKNGLLEMDDWVRSILVNVDLNRTIVVITGDHGEEMLEHGRLGHCSSLNAAQTITPCLMYIPGMKPRDVTFPTSHADILPTIADALGWQSRPATLGQSLYQPAAFRYAIVANFEYRKANRWSVVSDDCKAIVERDSNNQLQVIQLLDWEGRLLFFQEEPSRWWNVFVLIRRLEADLMAQAD